MVWTFKLQFSNSYKRVILSGAATWWSRRISFADKRSFDFGLRPSLRMTALKYTDKPKFEYFAIAYSWNKKTRT